MVFAEASGVFVEASGVFAEAPGGFAAGSGARPPDSGDFNGSAGIPDGGRRGSAASGQF